MTQDKHVGCYFLLIVVIVLNLAIVKNRYFQEVFAQTGFEEFSVGNLPKDWEVIGGDFEVSGDTVKTDKKALAILGGGDGDGVGVPIETEDPIISVELRAVVGLSISKSLLLTALAKTLAAPTSTGTRALSGFTTARRGNLLAILKPIHGNTSVLSLMSVKANLISLQEMIGTMP